VKGNEQLTQRATTGMDLKGIVLSEVVSQGYLHTAGFHLCDILENYGDEEETSGCPGLGMGGGRW